MTDNFLNKKFKYVNWQSAKILVLINCAVFIVTNYFPFSVRGVGIKYWLSLIPVFVHTGFIWQFATYMFVHSSLTHLFFNMYALLVFGSLAEESLGSKEFLLYYFLTGILGGVANYIAVLIWGGANIVVMGASGAIYALLFLIAVMFPRNGVLLFFIIPMRMPVAVFVFVAIEIISQISGMGADIAHLIHLSGILFGWLYCLIRFRISPIKVWRDTL